MIILDKWLTEQFNYNVYFLKKIDFNNLNFSNFNGRTFIYFKSPILNNKQIKFLVLKGFTLIEKNIQFKLQIKKNYKNKKNFRVANIKDKEVIKNISKTAFINSRFFIDPNIDNLIAEKIKTKWIDNYFKGNRGDILIVSEENNTISGFILLLFKGEKIIIDLIAVKNEFRGKDIATNLINYTINKFNNYKYLIVGTQKKNNASIKLYEKNNFVIESKGYIFHKHIF